MGAKSHPPLFFLASGGVVAIVLEQPLSSMGFAWLVVSIPPLILFFLLKNWHQKMWCFCLLAFMMSLALFCLGPFFSQILQRPSSHLGIPFQEVHQVQLSMLEDARVPVQGQWQGLGRVTWVEGRGKAASAQSILLISGQGNRPPVKGMHLSVQGQFSSTSPKMFWGKNWELLSFQSPLVQWRYYALSYFHHRFDALSHETATVCRALLLGQTLDPGVSLLRRFRHAGCAHLFALSGFHLSLLALAMRFFVHPLLGRQGAILFSCMASLLFLWLVGLRPSLVRAVMMYLLWSGYRYQNKRVEALVVLVQAFLIQGIFFPQQRQSLSFLLSYAALFGILAIGWPWGQWFSRWLPRSFALLVGGQIGAQAGTLPLVVGVFGVWRPIGLLASPLLTPPVALLMACGALFVCPLPLQVLSLLKTCLEGMNSILLWISHHFSQYREVSMAMITAWLIPLSIAILPHIFIWRIRHRRTQYHQSRFPSLHSCLPGQPRDCATQAMGTELPDQPRSPGENRLVAQARSRSWHLGNWSRTWGHERVHSQAGRSSHRLRNRPRLLRMASRVSGRGAISAHPGRCGENLEGSMGQNSS